MSTWADLALLRSHGMKPGLPVIVTTAFDLRVRTLAELGSMVIVHKPGEPLPASLLAGLRVWLFLDSCDRSHALVRMLNVRGVAVEELRGWCECERRLTSQPIPCAISADWSRAA